MRREFNKKKKCRAIKLIESGILIWRRLTFFEGLVKKKARGGFVIFQKNRER